MRQLIAVALFCAGLFCIAQAQVPMTGAGLGAPPSGAGCSQATTFLARTSGLNATHQNAYTTLICAGVTDGWWAKMDAFYIFATADSTTAGLNLVSTSFTITVHGSPTFTADSGYTGIDNSLTDWLDTGYNLSTSSTNYTQNSAHTSCWNNANVSTSNPCFSVTNGTVETDTYPKFSGNGDSFFRVNDTGGGTGGTTPAGAPVGQFIASRTGASAQNGYYNAAAQGLTPVTSGSPPNCNLFILGIDTCGTGFSGGSSYQNMETSIGGGFTGTDASNFCARVGAYLHTINGLTSPC